jgi:hypothetical protein
MELAGAPRTALRSAPFREKNRRGGSGRGEEAHNGANSERKRLGTATYAWSTKNFPATVFSALSRMGAEARRGKNGERKTRARGLPPLEAETRGKLENVGAGLRPGRLLLRERIRERRLEEGGGPDGWAPPVSRQREKLFSFYFPNKFSKHFSK